MLSINLNLIVECLRELSDQGLQRELWLSSGSDRVSSFVEAVEQLFTDSGLSDPLRKRTTGLGNEIEELLFHLEKRIDLVDSRRPPIQIIEDKQMNEVRKMAEEALNAIEDHQKKNKWKK